MIVLANEARFGGEFIFEQCAINTIAGHIKILRRHFELVAQHVGNHRGSDQLTVRMRKGGSRLLTMIFEEDDRLKARVPH